MSPYEEIDRALLESAAAGPMVPAAMAVELKTTASTVDTVRMRTLIPTPTKKPGGRTG
ncbi:hypothetical protein ACIF70_09195 [Actinacidiphila glaucinigra]|uniref:hypothetical protein n=1 Tax=Actinacidiphila glaucinigra TaxID=235986 RepID=UPI0037C5F3E3